MAYQFMGKHGITAYPNEYMLKYSRREVVVVTDPHSEMPYVLHNNKKLFFPVSLPVHEIQRVYRSLLIEQDIESAHRYVTSYKDLQGKTLLDIGAAEGIFSLDVIDFVGHVYLFECEESWLAPLRATFEPWKQKVTIVQNFVGQSTTNDHITIDDFLYENEMHDLFIKMDIEGGELHALTGAMKTLQSGKNIHVAICTYHNIGDPEAISHILNSAGFRIEFSTGLIYWRKKLSKGIIRGIK